MKEPEIKAIDEGNSELFDHLVELQTQKVYGASGEDNLLITNVDLESTKKSICLPCGELRNRKTFKSTLNINNQNKNSIFNPIHRRNNSTEENGLEMQEVGHRIQRGGRGINAWGSIEDLLSYTNNLDGESSTVRIAMQLKERQSELNDIDLNLESEDEEDEDEKDEEEEKEEEKRKLSERKIDRLLGRNQKEKFRPVHMLKKAVNRAILFIRDPFAETGKKPVFAKGMRSEDYTSAESEVKRIYQLAHLDPDNKRMYSKKYLEGKSNRHSIHRSFLRFCILTIIAILTMSLYILITFASNALFFLVRQNMMSESLKVYQQYLVYIGFSVVYLTIAFLSVLWCPQATGSGIPETIAFLNGLHLPYTTTSKVLLAKTVGICFSVGAPIPVGKLGPTIHLGTSVAASLGKLLNEFLQSDKYFDIIQTLSNAEEQRDFAVAGAAAGVTAAFASPLGGLMLVWEESASYWNLNLSRRVFYCNMVAIIFAYYVSTLIYDNNKNNIDNPLSISFLLKFLYDEFFLAFSGGSLTCEQEESHSTHRWGIKNLMIFILIGILGGLLGAFWIELSKSLMQFRARIIKNWLSKYLQVLLLAILYPSITLGLSHLSSTWACKPLPPVPYNVIGFDDYAKKLLLNIGCEDNYYNEVGSLFLNNGLKVLQILYHTPTKLPITDETMGVAFSCASLALVAFVHFFAILWTFGISIPSGFFVPELILGALLGRLGYTLLVPLDDTQLQVASDVALYSLMGATAFIGGCSRMVISMALMLEQGIGSVSLLLPLAIILMTARGVANVFNKSIFETVIEFKGWPILGESAPKHSIIYDVRAGDVGNSEKLKTLHPIASVAKIYKHLMETKHNLFPVVYPKGHSQAGQLYGTVSRTALIVLFKSHAISKNSSVDTNINSARIISPIMSFEAHRKLETQLTTQEIENPKLSLDKQSLLCFVDLRPYICTSLYLVNRACTILKVYKLFRGQGLRHLLVVDDTNGQKLHSIITRHDLLSYSLKKNTRRKAKRRTLRAPVSGLDAINTHYWRLPLMIEEELQAATGDRIKPRRNEKKPGISDNEVVQRDF